MIFKENTKNHVNQSQALRDYPLNLKPSWKCEKYTIFSYVSVVFTSVMFIVYLSIKVPTLG